MLRSRSVTGWPHHLIPQISCAPAVQRDLQNHSRPGRHRGNLRCARLGMWLDKEGTCFASSLMRERYPPSPPIHWGLPRLADCKSAVIKTSRKRDPWCITTNSHHSPYPRHGFRSRSRRGAWLSTVSLTSASLVGIGAAHGSISIGSCPG